jgi:Uma2 family endonuclease
MDDRGDGQNDGRAVSLDLYLHSVYEPDCDYVDGHLQERNLGEFDHGDLQSQLVYLFRLNASWGVRCVVEVRLQVKATRFLVPDVMVLNPGQKRMQIIREAPLLCIEVLSPEDRWKRLKTKVEDYLAMGVGHVWAFDPSTREAYVCDEDGFHKVSTDHVSIPGTAISLRLTDIFSVLDSE